MTITLNVPLKQVKEVVRTASLKSRRGRLPSKPKAGPEARVVSGPTNSLFDRNPHEPTGVQQTSLILSKEIKEYDSQIKKVSLNIGVFATQSFTEQFNFWSYNYQQGSVRHTNKYDPSQFHHFWFQTNLNTFNFEVTRTIMVINHSDIIIRHHDGFYFCWYIFSITLDFK